MFVDARKTYIQNVCNTHVHLKILTHNSWLSAPTSVRPGDQFDPGMRTSFAASQQRPHRGFEACAPFAKLSYI